MHTIIRDLSYIADYFDSLHQYQVSNIIDSASKSLLYNESSYNENIKTASISNYDDYKCSKLMDIVDVAEKLSEIDMIIASTKNEKVRILFSCVCSDLAQMFKDASFGIEKQAAGIGGFLKGLGSFISNAFKGWTDSSNLPMKGQLVNIRNKIGPMLDLIENFQKRVKELGPNSLAIAQLEDKFIKNLIPVTRYLTNVYSSSRNAQDTTVTNASKGILDSIRSLINNLPSQKDSQYSNQLDGAVNAFAQGLRVSVDETTSAISTNARQMARNRERNMNRDTFDMEKFLKRARIAKSRAKKFVENNGSRGKQILEYLGVDEEWYTDSLTHPKDTWPKTHSWNLSNESHRVNDFQYRLQQLIESSSDVIWEDLKQLGMTPRGSWREEGYQRGLGKKNNLF